MKVTLRTRKTTRGLLALYADAYPTPPGEKRFTPLGLHVPVRPRTPEERQFRKDVMKIAQKRCLEIAAAIVSGVSREDRKGMENIFHYLRVRAESVKPSHGKSIRAMMGHLAGFLDRDIMPFRDITLEQIDGFRDYLLMEAKSRYGDPLAHNSAAAYFAVLGSALKDAYRCGHLQEDISAKMLGITPREGNRGFFTVNELNLLWETPCPGAYGDIVKRAAMFSALTALRWSDVSALRREHIRHVEGIGPVVDFEQQKTGEDNWLPISDQAVALLGDTPPGEKIFPVEYDQMRVILEKWMALAGFPGSTFHKFRHSFATNQLLKGTDIYTVSGMMGHKSVRSTQIYGKVVASVKALAAGRVRIKM